MSIDKAMYAAPQGLPDLEGPDVEIEIVEFHQPMPGISYPLCAAVYCYLLGADTYWQIDHCYTAIRLYLH